MKTIGLFILTGSLMSQASPTQGTLNVRDVSNGTRDAWSTKVAHPPSMLCGGELHLMYQDAAYLRRLVWTKDAKDVRQDCDDRSLRALNYCRMYPSGPPANPNFGRSCVYFALEAYKACESAQGVDEPKVFTNLEDRIIGAREECHKHFQKCEKLKESTLDHDKCLDSEGFSAMSCYLEKANPDGSQECLAPFSKSGMACRKSTDFNLCMDKAVRDSAQAC
ncbi:hypothetical protein CDD83_10916 [Cordyceps sp. RAO-2017]|nr:hypothetical protein CDD83_10916 [Cordyceps sp. RAO-2017]